MAIQAPPLEGWLTLSELAERIGYTRQGVNYLAEHDKIKSLRSVARGKFFLMREAEIPDIKKRLWSSESGRAHGGQDPQHESKSVTRTEAQSE